MQMGLYTREGKHLVGRIGDLVLSWNRHAGGKLGTSLLVDGKPIPLGNFTMSAQLEEIALCSAADPDQSDIEVRIPFLEDRLRLDMVCRLTALQRWDLAEIQYCNFFPEENRDPDTWHSELILALADDGQYMCIDHRGDGESRLLSGTAFHNYEDNLFLALYGGPHGNIFALSRPRQIEGAKPVYQLCNCWLDNHFILSAAAGEIAAGTSYEVELTLMLARTSRIDTDIEALGRQALETGTL